LDKLHFDMYPSLAPLFARLVLLSGSLDFPSPSIIKLVMDLTQGILFKSLTNYRLSTVRPSDKAQAALEIAVEFIFFHFKLYSNRDVSRYEIMTPQPGQIIGDFAVDLCFEAYLQRFIPKKLPSTVQTMIPSPIVASPVRDVKV